MGRVYLDHNATCPLDLGLREALPAWFETFGNPSSLYKEGQEAKAILRSARGALAELLGCHPLELIFTSSGSESNNLALKGVCRRLREKNPDKILRVLTTTVEHPSVARALEQLSEEGVLIEQLAVSRQGEIDWEEYHEKLARRPHLVSAMLANNETGAIFPVREMAEVAHAQGALFHTDAVQALGKMKVCLAELGVDLASFSGHKFYSLRGAGLLYVRRGVELKSEIAGGGQERHRRAGTENLLAIRALGWMASEKIEVMEASFNRVEKLRNEMEKALVTQLDGVRVLAQTVHRLSNTSCLHIAGVSGDAVLMNLDLKGFSISTGAACSSGNPAPSPTLLAMGLKPEEAQSCVRVSLGWNTRPEDLRRFTATLIDVVRRLRGLSKSSPRETAAHEKVALHG